MNQSDSDQPAFDRPGYTLNSARGGSAPPGHPPLPGLEPLETLYEAGQGAEVELPGALSTLYGRLRIPRRSGRSHVMGNFVTTLDGVVSLGVPGQTGGGEISGFNQHDRLVMAVLRAIADCVVVGAGTLRAVPRHLWTAQYIYPQLEAQYRQLRSSLGKGETPLNVIVTARGEIDLELPVFHSGAVQVLIVTTQQGASRLHREGIPSWVRIAVMGEAGLLTAGEVLNAVRGAGAGDLVLVEGGPQLMGDFLAEGLLNELFLTLAPQVAGRDGATERPGLVAGKSFAPEHPIWGRLAGVKRAGSHLFLRYDFE